MTPEITNELMAHAVVWWRARKRRAMVSEWLLRRAAMKRYWPNPWHYRFDLEAMPTYRGRTRVETGIW